MEYIFLIHKYATLCSLNHPRICHLVNRWVCETEYSSHGQSPCRSRIQYCWNIVVYFSLSAKKRTHQKNTIWKTYDCHDTTLRCRRIMVFFSSTERYTLTWICLCPYLITTNIYDHHFISSSQRTPSCVILCFCSHDNLCQHPPHNR